MLPPGDYPADDPDFHDLDMALEAEERAWGELVKAVESLDVLEPST
jgi:hypothetical protein